MPIRVFPRGFGKNKPRVSGATYKKMVARKRRNTLVGGSFAKRVLSVLKRQEETKYVASDLDSTGAAHPTLWYPTPNMVNTGAIIPAIPIVSQGVGDYERIGNKINPTSVTVTLQVGLNPLDLNSTSLTCVLWYGTSKSGKTWNQNPLPTIALLENGNGAANSGWAGLRNQMNLPFDTSLVTLKRIVFKLSKSGGLQNADLGLPGPDGNLSTSNGSSVKNFTLRFTPPKTLVYGTNADVYPQNFAPFYYIGFCHSDGSQYTPADAEIVNVNSRVHMKFKDA